MYHRLFTDYFYKKTWIQIDQMVDAGFNFLQCLFSELADFFCFLSIHLYTDQIFYHGYLYLHGF